MGKLQQMELYTHTSRSLSIYKKKNMWNQLKNFTLGIKEYGKCFYQGI